MFFEEYCLLLHTQMLNIIILKQIIFRFGMLAAAILILLQLSQYSYATRRFSEEWLVILFALFFVGLGMIMTRLVKGKSKDAEADKAPVESKENIVPDEKKLEQLGISRRELEVLRLVARGCSNQEIAKELFIAESTVKTHVSSLLQKLEAKRRTQAVIIARELQLIG